MVTFPSLPIAADCGLLRGPYGSGRLALLRKHQMLRQRLVPTGSRAPASANLDVPVDVLQRLLLAAGPFSFGLLKCREPLGKLHSLGVPCTVVDSKGRTMLHWAAFTDESELVATLLDGCADVDLQDQEGNTALHLAASNNATGVLKKLLEHGACRSIRNV